MEENGCEMYSSITETGLDSLAHPLYGKFDLLVGSRIVDYKTGKTAALSDIMKKMNTAQKQDHFEFQPLIYLSLLKDNSPPTHRVSLVYVGGNDIRSVTDEHFNIKDNVREVVLLEESMEAFLSDPNSPVKASFGKSYQKMTDGWSTLVSEAFRSGKDHSSWRNDEPLIASILGALGISDAKTNRDNVSKILRKLSDIISSGMFVDVDEIAIPSDTLEKFLSMIDKDHDLASAQTYTEFPASPRRNCSECDFYKVCTRDVIELDGDGGEENGEE
jgi:hypothetical protein